MLKYIVIIVGILLSIWGIHSIKTNTNTNKKARFALLDIFINGWGSGFGMFLSGLVVASIGIVMFFMK